MLDWLQLISWVACIVGQVTLLCLIIQRSLASRYPFLAGWLAANIFQSALLGGFSLCGLGNRTWAYYYAWQWTEVPILIGWVCMSLHALERIVLRYNAASSWIRRRMIQVVLVAACLGVLTAAVQIRVHSTIASINWALLSEGIAATCFLSIVLAWGRLWLGNLLAAPHPRNVRLHCRTLAAYFALVWIGCALIHLTSGRLMAYGSILLMVGECACYLSWMRMTIAGESPTKMFPLTGEEEVLSMNFHRHAGDVIDLYRTRKR